MKEAEKMGKLTTSRRYNQLPLLRSSPGGFEGSWPYRTYPGAKVLQFRKTANFLFEKIDRLLRFYFHPFGCFQMFVAILNLFYQLFG